MPQALESLAAWPVLMAFLFLFRGLGVAYNEVVVAALEQEGAWRNLQRFSHLLSLAMTGVLLLVALSPLARLFFGGVMGLTPGLVALSSRGLLLTLLWPALTVYQNLYQGVIVYGGKTQHVTQSVVLSLLTSVALLIAGVRLGTLPGLYVATLAFVAGSAVQVAWLDFSRQRGGAASASASRDGQSAPGARASFLTRTPLPTGRGCRACRGWLGCPRRRRASPD